MTLPTLKAIGLGAAIVAATAGTAFAATATASANVRSGPGPQYRVVDTLYPGERVSVNARAGSWCHVQKSGPDGWVSCRYVSNSRYDRPPRYGYPYGVPPRHNPYPRDRYHDWNNDGWNNDGWDNGPYDGWYNQPQPGVSFGFTFSR